MAKYQAQGRVTLSGVWFGVTARSLAEAQDLLLRGQFDWTEEKTAELVDWDVNLATVEEDML